MSIKKHPIISGAEPYHLKGNGPSILLIHGLSASPTELRPIGEFLHSKGFDVHSMLLPGHGTSPEDLRTKKRKDWWIGVKEAFESIENCEYVLGFSLGALLASRLAVEYSNRLKGLILISTFMKVRPRIISILAFLFPILKLFKPYFNKEPGTEEYFKKHNLISYLKYPTVTIYEGLKLSKYTKRRIIPKITIPTLIVQGLKDDRVVASSYKTILKLIKAKKIEVLLLPESQHIVTVGPDKETLLTAIGNFLMGLEK
ncbi:MAG: alpha/beta fold hydrolase [Candidatus Heimdallarchaeota archaeon]|nr:alpha/beta fold hydrolase [Candidatus Heimdallarchaeota archaeon]